MTALGSGDAIGFRVGGRTGGFLVAGVGRGSDGVTVTESARCTGGSVGLRLQNPPKTIVETTVSVRIRNQCFLWPRDDKTATSISDGCDGGSPAVFCSGLCAFDGLAPSRAIFCSSMKNTISTMTHAMPPTK